MTETLPATGRASARPTRDRVAALVDQATRGDGEAFGLLFRLLRPRVYRLACGYVGPGAEDAVSETFLRAWAALPRYRRTRASFAAWLCGIARHVAADQWRARRREEPRGSLPDGEADGSVDERLTLESEIERLPPAQRSVVEGKFLVGLSNRELAAALGRSVGAINTLRWRALQTLHSRLEGSRRM